MFLWALLFFRGLLLILLRLSDFTPMEHSSISGGYTDSSVPTSFPLSTDTPRVRHLPACPLGTDGAITPQVVSATPVSILVVPPVDV